MSEFNAILIEDSGSPFTLVSVNVDTVSDVRNYIEQFYKNHSDSSRFRLHVVSLAFDFTKIEERGGTASDVVHYDYTRNPFDSLGVLLKKYTANTHASARNVMIIDDLQLFLVYADKDFGRLTYFFRTLAKTCQVFTTVIKETSSPTDFAFCHSLADTVVTLENTQGQSGQGRILCNILKTKPSGKIVHNQSTFNLINGVIHEISNSKNVITTSGSVNINRHNLNTLTTFKLTLEDDEQETKDRLYLPYFNAQSSSSATSADSSLFEEDDDEDDEEI